MKQQELDAIRKRGSFVGYKDAELSLAERDRRNLLAETDRLRAAVTKAGWPKPRSIKTTPKKGDFLAWFPILELDDDDRLTDRVVGGHWFVTQKEANGAITEPEALNAIGAWAGDREEYGDPTLWIPVPPDPVTIVTRTDADSKRGRR